MNEPQVVVKPSEVAPLSGAMACGVPQNVLVGAKAASCASAALLPSPSPVFFRGSSCLAKPKSTSFAWPRSSKMTLLALRSR